MKGGILNRFLASLSSSRFSQFCGLGSHGPLTFCFSKILTMTALISKQFRILFLTCVTLASTVCYPLLFALSWAPQSLGQPHL